MEVKVGIITGAAGGIGRALARVMAGAGFRLALVDRNADSLTDLNDELLDLVPADHIMCATEDCTDLAGMVAVTRECVERFGRLDAVVLNAGIEGPVSMIADIDPDQFDRVMAVNVRGPLIGLKASFPALQASGGGAVVIMSSVAGAVGTPGLSAYTTSKHAVVGLMRCAAIEGAPHNIRVNTVNPGPVETRMMRALEEGFAPEDPSQAKLGQIGLIPMNRYAYAEEVAKFTGYLLSNEASYCTGQTYYIDGGMLAGKVRL